MVSELTKIGALASNSLPGQTSTVQAIKNRYPKLEIIEKDNMIFIHKKSAVLIIPSEHTNDYYYIVKGIEQFFKNSIKSKQKF